MSIGSGAFVLIVTVLAIGILVVFFGTRNHPETGSGHEQTTHPRTGDRPAGPGAETMNPENLGGDHTPPRSSDPGSSR